MLFEPGSNAAVGNQWEGFDVDRQVMQYLKNNGYGGVGCWAMNHLSDR